MLELIFQGFMEWAYGLALECWEYFSSSLLDIMSMDYAYMKSHVPVMVSIAQVLLAVGWALLIGNLVFQALKSMAVGLGFEGEDPKLLFTRTFVFAFLLMASPQICEVGLSLTARIIELLEIPDAINVTLVDEGMFGSLGAAWLLVIIFGLIIMLQVFRLLLEIAERYVILAVLTMTAPLAFAMGGSKSTSEIFGGWCRMFGSVCTLMVTNVIFFKMLLSVLSNVPSGLDIIPWIVLVLTIVKVARKAEAIITRIGLNPAITGDSLGRGFPGTLTYLVMRSATSHIRGGQRTPKLFLRRIWRKNNFGVRRNKGGGAAGVLFSVRDVDVLRLLCWCQNIRPQDLNSISTKAERENLMALGFIKLHERSGTLTLTGSGRALLELIFNGAIPSLSLSYHGAAIERRIRLSRLMLSAYRAGIDVFAPEVNVAREIPSLFLTSITRTRGRNSWGSSRVAAIVSLGGIYYAAHYVCPGIGRMAVNDELAAFHNHTNFGKNTQRAFLFAGSSYESVIEELKTQDEKRNEKLIRYGEAYHCLHAPIHLLSCDETGAQQLQIMTVPDYRVKLTRLMLRSAYQPPPEDIAAWDGLYNGHPFVIGADMDLRRIDTAVRTAKQHGCLPIALAALESQGSAVLLQRYADPGCATVYKVTENVLSELLGRAPNLYVPPRTQFLTEKGDVVDAPLIKAPGKAGGPHRK